MLVDSSAALLTVYSARLQELRLRIYSSDSTDRLLELDLECSQLRSLTIPSRCARSAKPPGQWLPEHYVDVERLDRTVAALPPLRLLTELTLRELRFTVRAITRFLNQCPEVRSFVVRDVCRKLPEVLELAGGRTVELHHAWDVCTQQPYHDYGCPWCERYPRYR